MTEEQIPTVQYSTDISHGFSKSPDSTSPEERKHVFLVECYHAFQCQQMLSVNQHLTSVLHIIFWLLVWISSIMFTTLVGFPFPNVWLKVISFLTGIVRQSWCSNILNTVPWVIYHVIRIIVYLLIHAGMLLYGSQQTSSRLMSLGS